MMESTKNMVRWLHPVRLELLRIFAARGEYTPQVLSVMLPDIPQATLYRQINGMVKDGFLQVVNETKVRGTVKRVYAIKVNPFENISQSFKDMKQDEIIQLFFSFCFSQLIDFSDFAQYHETGATMHHVGFMTQTLHLTQSDFQTFIHQLQTLVTSYQTIDTKDQSSLIKFSFSLIPNTEKEARL